MRSLLLLTLAVPSWATSSPRKVQSPPSCRSEPEIGHLVRLFYDCPPTGHDVCWNKLHLQLTEPQTVTETSWVTTHPQTTATQDYVSTEYGAVTTVTIPSNATLTVATTRTSTAPGLTVTRTVTTSTAVATTVITSLVTGTPTTTSFTTVYTADPVTYGRTVTITYRDLVERNDDQQRVFNVPRSVAVAACECAYEAPSTQTITVTSTSTGTPETMTVSTATKTVTVPVSTQIFTNFVTFTKPVTSVTVVRSANMTTEVTALVPVTSTVLATSTLQAAEPVNTHLVQVTYTQADIGGEHCYFGISYKNFETASGFPADGNYLPNVRECEQACLDDGPLCGGFNLYSGLLSFARCVLVQPNYLQSPDAQIYCSPTYIIFSVAYVVESIDYGQSGTTTSSTATTPGSTDTATFIRN